MKCNVIRDLLASYNDDLLEEETRKEVEKHLAECEECRKLNETYSAELTAKNDEPTETAGINPFKKIRRKIKKIKIRALIAVLAASMMAVGAGVLTVGEIIKYEEFPSWSSVIQTIEVRSALNHLLKGDIDGFYKYVYMPEPIMDKFSHSYRPAGISEESLPTISNDGSKQVEIYMKDLLKSSYDNDIKGKDIIVSYVYTSYMDNSTDRKELITTAYVRVDDTDLEFSFTNNGNSKFDTYCEALPIDDDGDESDDETGDINENSYINDFGNACQLLNYVNPDGYMNFMFDGSTRARLYFELDRPEDDKYLEEHIITENSESRRYGSKYQDMCNALEKKGASLSACDSGQLWFDPEKKCFANTMSTLITYGESEAIIKFTVAIDLGLRYIIKDSIDVINDGIPEDIMNDYLSILYYLGE